MESYFVYDFEWQMMFKAKYKAKNRRFSQELKRYDEKNIGFKGSLLAKAYKTNSIVLFSYGKKIRHVNLLIFYYLIIMLLI